MDIYNNIKKIANEKKISISNLEKGAGISNGSIGKWKHSSPKISTLKAVTDVLGVSLIDILGEVEKESKTIIGGNKEITGSPAYTVRPVNLKDIVANNYNPNYVDKKTMESLYNSIKKDGYTLPIVCGVREDGKYEIIDGYHRYLICKEYLDINEREHNTIPVVVLNENETDQVSSTILHNSARGTHSTELMSNIVIKLKKAGMSDKWIEKNLGMEYDELLHLKQLTGLQEMFKDKDFSEAWEFE